MILPTLTNFDGRNLNRIDISGPKPLPVRLEYVPAQRMVIVQFDGGDVFLVPIEQVACMIPLAEDKKAVLRNPLEGLDVSPVTGEAKPKPAPVVAEVPPPAVMQPAHQREIPESLHGALGKALREDLPTRTDLVENDRPDDTDEAEDAPPAPQKKRGRPRRR